MYLFTTTIISFNFLRVFNIVLLFITHNIIIKLNSRNFKKEIKKLLLAKNYYDLKEFMAENL